VDAPSEGCPVRTGVPERDRVAQITQSVLDELRKRGAL